MSCPLRRNDGSGFKKAEDPELEVRNNCALAELMAAREAQDAALYSAWTGEAAAVTVTDTSAPAPASSLPPPVFTVPLSETCFQVDGHIYKIPDEERARKIQKSLEELAAEREKEEAKWAAYWKEAAPVAPRPAWETTEEVSEPRVSEPIDFSVAETKTEDLPQIEVSES
jgi:hypothetical protein